MRPEEAIEHAPASLIKAEADQGIVTIYRSEPTTISEGDYHVRFIPRDDAGNLTMSDIVLLGSYHSLDQALAVAWDKHRVSGDVWSYQVPVELVEDGDGALRVEGKVNRRKSS